MQLQHPQEQTIGAADEIERGASTVGIPRKLGVQRELLRDRNRSEATSFLARPERLELPTYWFEASRSIQLSYGRAIASISTR